MHILILPTKYPNRYELQSHSYIQDQAKALTGAGEQVSVLALTPISFKQIISNPKWAFGLWKSKHDQILTWLCQFPSIPKFRALNNSIRVWIGKRLFKRYIKEYGLPDIVHVHIYLAGGLAIWIKEKYDVPFVVTEHYSHFASGTLTTWQNGFARKVFQQSSYNIAVSRKFCHLLEKEYNSNFVYAPNCVDTNYFKPNKQVESKSTVTFINVANLKKIKNHIMLINAFSDAFRKNPKYHLIIAGSGPESAKLQSLIRSLGMESNITLFGFATRAQVLTLMREASFFVLSSRYETFGVVLIEAMSCGLPVVSTRSGGPESIIVNNKLGLLCDVDQEQLAKAMVEVTTSNFDKNYIRKYCIDHYSEQTIATRLLEIYEQIQKEEQPYD